MFVAVRAIAPVTGIPENIGDIIFPIPCATSSIFDLCRVPIIPSATTADNSDSIAAKIAIVKATKIISRETIVDTLSTKKRILYDFKKNNHRIF